MSLAIAGDRLRVREAGEGANVDAVWHAGIPRSGDHPLQGKAPLVELMSSSCHPPSPRKMDEKYVSFLNICVRVSLVLVFVKLGYVMDMVAKVRAQYFFRFRFIDF